MKTNLREEIKEILTDTFFCSIFSKEMHDRVLSEIDEQAFDECVEELETLINEHTNEERRALLQMVNRTLKEDGITDANGEEITFTYWQDREIKL